MINITYSYAEVEGAPQIQAVAAVTPEQAFFLVHKRGGVVHQDYID